MHYFRLFLKLLVLLGVNFLEPGHQSALGSAHTHSPRLVANNSPDRVIRRTKKNFENRSKTSFITPYFQAWALEIDHPKFDCNTLNDEVIANIWDWAEQHTPEISLSSSVGCAFYGIGPIIFSFDLLIFVENGADTPALQKFLANVNGKSFGPASVNMKKVVGSFLAPGVVAGKMSEPDAWFEKVAGDVDGIRIRFPNLENAEKYNEDLSIRIDKGPEEILNYLAERTNEQIADHFRSNVLPQSNFIKVFLKPSYILESGEIQTPDFGSYIIDYDCGFQSGRVCM